MGDRSVFAVAFVPFVPFVPVKSPQSRGVLIFAHACTRCHWPRLLKTTPNAINNPPLLSLSLSLSLFIHLFFFLFSPLFSVSFITSFSCILCYRLRLSMQSSCKAISKPQVESIYYGNAPRRALPSD